MTNTTSGHGNRRAGLWGLVEAELYTWGSVCEAIAGGGYADGAIGIVVCGIAIQTRGAVGNSGNGGGDRLASVD